MILEEGTEVEEEVMIPWLVLQLKFAWALSRGIVDVLLILKANQFGLS